MKTYSTLLFLLITQLSYAQYWVAGDSTNLIVNHVNTLYYANATLSFDIDCDGLEDFNIYSTRPSTTGGSPWMRLSFYMENGVEAFNSNTGYITLFETGDTVILTNNTNWTPSLDYIYGTGAMGSYGLYNITDKYIAYRKSTALDTNYCYLFFSNNGIDLTLHHVISTCANNPLSMISNTKKVEQNNKLDFYPNPTTNKITLSPEVNSMELYSVTGVLIEQKNINSKDVDLSHLAKGIYLIKLISGEQFKIKKLTML